jgi:hypothetical protein
MHNIGIIPCGSLETLVLVTAPPYPMGMQNLSTDSARRYMTTANLAALGQYILHGVARGIEKRRMHLQRNITRTRPLPLFQSLDAFSIIRPRLIFPNEVEAKNHFLARITHNKTHYELLTTPAGLEVLNGIALAVSCCGSGSGGGSGNQKRDAPSLLSDANRDVFTVISSPREIIPAGASSTWVRTVS